MVNTFILYSDLALSAKTLDNSRRFKQVVEARQILTVLEKKKQGIKCGWQSHPAVVQWENHLMALKRYFNIHHDAVLDAKTHPGMQMVKYEDVAEDVTMPDFVHSPHTHYSHRASLIRKDSRFYSAKLACPRLYHEYGYFWSSKAPKINSETLLFDLANAPPATTAMWGKRLKKLLAPLPVSRPYCIATLKKGGACKHKQKNKDSEYCGVHKPRATSR